MVYQTISHIVIYPSGHLQVVYMDDSVVGQEGHYELDLHLYEVANRKASFLMLHPHLVERLL